MLEMMERRLEFETCAITPLAKSTCVDSILSIYLPISRSGLGGTCLEFPILCVVLKSSTGLSILHELPFLAYLKCL
jgi:hypothetical protein